MKRKTWMGIASFFLTVSVAILLAIVFFGDKIDSFDSYINDSTLLTSETNESENTTVIETTEQATETTTKAETTTEVKTTTRPSNSIEGEKLVAFTFDDGPNRRITPQILDVLEYYNSKATFFVVGNAAAGNADIFKRMSDMGCQIGNHSYDHSRYSLKASEEISENFLVSQRAILSAAGTEPKLFRVPYGENDAKILESIDVPLVYWSIDTLDWAKKDKPNVNRTEEERNNAIDVIYHSVVDNVVPGDIVLMHDLYEITLDSFEKIINTLILDGWELVTVSGLYERRGYELPVGRVNRCAR